MKFITKSFIVLFYSIPLSWTAEHELNVSWPLWYQNPSKFLVWNRIARSNSNPEFTNVEYDESDHNLCPSSSSCTQDEFEPSTPNFDLIQNEHLNDFRDDHSNNKYIPLAPFHTSQHVQVTKPLPVPVYKEIDVPVLRPVKIHVPHPVAVNVPQPYPVALPIWQPVPIQIMKSVAVPVERKITYPVEKHIPVPVEKPIPIIIERSIPIPVEEAVPIKIPIYKTIHHVGIKKFPGN